MMPYVAHMSRCTEVNCFFWCLLREPPWRGSITGKATSYTFGAKPRIPYGDIAIHGECCSASTRSLPTGKDFVPVGGGSCELH